MRCRLPKKPHRSSQKPICDEARLSKKEDLSCRSALTNCHLLWLCEGLSQDKLEEGAEFRKEIRNVFFLEVSVLRVSKNNQITLI